MRQVCVGAIGVIVMGLSACGTASEGQDGLGGGVGTLGGSNARGGVSSTGGVGSGGLFGAGGVATGVGGSIDGAGGSSFGGASISSGGTSNPAGGSSAGGSSAGGNSNPAGGAGNSSGGASNPGNGGSGNPSGGTSNPMGGRANAGAGGTATGGSASGGTGNGGMPGAGGRANSGGASSGGTGSGGASSGGTGTGGSTSSCSVSPVNPKATQQAKNLLCYLYSVYGKSVLSGQQETSWVSNPATDVNWINTQTGKYPAVLGGDYLYPNGTTSRAQAWWVAGGIPMIRYHMGAPPLADTYDNAKGTADINAVLTSGTSANTSFNSKLDYVAKELQTLQTANVAVIWAPFHETQANGWFWWAKGTGAQFISLWKYMYNYLTNTKGINNVVWLMPFSGTPSSAYYPGKEYLDISGPDTYATGQPFASMYNTAKGIIGGTVPIPLHETGIIPNPDQMFPSAAPWLLFNIWAGYENDTSQNSVANIKSTYANARTITRDEVPNLK